MLCRVVCRRGPACRDRRGGLRQDAGKRMACRCWKKWRRFCGLRGRTCPYRRRRRGLCRRREDRRRGRRNCRGARGRPGWPGLRCEERGGPFRGSCVTPATDEGGEFFEAREELGKLREGKGVWAVGERGSGIVVGFEEDA